MGRLTDGSFEVVCGVVGWLCVRVGAKPRRLTS